MSELTHREKIAAKSVITLSWDASFAKLVEYVGENFKQPSSVEGPTSDNGGNETYPKRQSNCSYRSMQLN